MVLQALLLAVATFIFAIDQFSLTELLYRPIIACPIIGVILGDVKTGLVIGGTYELMMVGNMPVGGAQPPNAVLGSIVAMIFAVKSGLPVDQALGLAVVHLHLCHTSWLRLIRLLKMQIQLESLV